MHSFKKKKTTHRLIFNYFYAAYWHCTVFTNEHIILNKPMNSTVILNYNLTNYKIYTNLNRTIIKKKCFHLDANLGSRWIRFCLKISFLWLVTENQPVCPVWTPHLWPLTSHTCARSLLRRPRVRLKRLWLFSATRWRTADAPTGSLSTKHSWG